MLQSLLLLQTTGDIRDVVALLLIADWASAGRKEDQDWRCQGGAWVWKQLWAHALANAAYY